MFLRHIQLIFSSPIKTLKLGKCFVEGNNFLDKLACCHRSATGLKYGISKGDALNSRACEQMPLLKSCTPNLKELVFGNFPQ